MSKASETARAELVAAEILDTAGLMTGWAQHPPRYEQVAAMLALAYVRGRQDATTAHAARIERLERGAS